MSGPETRPITFRGVVYPRDLDHMGHMNVAGYVVMFDQATWSFWNDLGFSPATLRDGPYGFAAVRYDVTYKRELVAGDVVTVRSWITRLGRTSVGYAHEMTNGATGDVAASAEITGVLIDRKTRRPVPWPEDVAQRLRAAIDLRGT